MEEISEAESKTGKELFLELARRLPSAQAEDYYRNRIWLDEDMLLDLNLLEAHRREAGADDPPTLEELKEQGEYPALPDDKPAAWALGVQRPVGTFGGMPAKVGSVGMLAKPVGSALGSGAKAGALKPTNVLKTGLGTATSGLRPAPPKNAPPPGMISAGGVSGPSAELRQIALFIAKWKLEATKTKLSLARLTPPRRRWVMTNFKQTGTSPSVTAQLEQFISQAERDNSWKSADSPAASNPGVGTLKPTSGLKRPLSAASSSGTADPNKRPKLLSGGNPPKTSALKPTLGKAAAKPVSAYIRINPVTSGAFGASRPGLAKPAAPKAAVRSAYGTGAPAYGVKPGIAKPVGTALARPGALKPTAPKATIRPQLGATKPLGGKPGPAKAAGKSAAKPGSLIADLLKL